MRKMNSDVISIRVKCLELCFTQRKYWPIIEALVHSTFRHPIIENFSIFMSHYDDFQAALALTWWGEVRICLSHYP